MYANDLLPSQHAAEKLCWLTRILCLYTWVHQWWLNHQTPGQCNTVTLLMCAFMELSDHTVSLTIYYDDISWHIDKIPYHNACDINTILFKSSKNVHHLKNFFINSSALVAYWHSDSCTGCSHLINYSTEQEQYSKKGVIITWT